MDQIACPRFSGLVCNGQGTCASGASGDGKCTCNANSADGFWTGDACQSCVSTWAGSTCTVQCPGSGLCGGHGVCNDGRSGSGDCTCDFGYGGPSCTIECPGLADGRVCNARGTCQPDATCLCDASDSLGYWAGTNCDTCDLRYSGGNCDKACPTSGHSDVQDAPKNPGSHTSHVIGSISHAAPQKSP